MSAITLSPEYGYVLAVAAGSTLLPLVLGGQVSGKRKLAKVPYPHMYATAAECAEDKHKMIFNCYQRAHQNFLESYPTFLTCIAIAGIEFPRTSAIFGSVWLFGRALYSRNYQKGDPSKRNSGIAWIHYIGILSLMGMSIYSGVKISLSALTSA